MSVSIDEKVVEMRFDNRNFESGVSESMSTIERLKAALKFGDSADGLENIGRAARNVNLDSMTESAKECKLQFSALQIAAITAIQDITRAAERYGKKLVMALGPDQVSSGWSKYADKTAAVQTIMAATSMQFEDTGLQMAYVNEQLDKLNWFTDETSFNFLDMVNNIGKFTSNNIDLETSVTAMEGISNWAAISGATINEAGRAMYNLSQAISMGSLKLQDWKSIELANMATAEFKQTAIEMGLQLKVLEERMDGVYVKGTKTEVSIESFRESLKEGWLNSDVLLSTLEQYGAFTDKLNEAMTKLGADMSASEFLGYLEDYERGILDITEVADEFGISASKLEAYLEELSSEEYDLGKRSFRAAQEAKTFKEAIDATKDAVSTGWMTSFEKIFGGYTEAKKMWSQFAEDLWEIFASGGTRRNNFLSDIFDTSWQKITREVNKAGVNVEQFEGKIKELGREANPDFDALLQQFGSLEEMFLQGAISTDLITDALDIFSNMTAGTGTDIGALNDRFTEFQDVVNQMWWGGFGKGEDAINNLTEAGYDYNFVSKLMEKTATEFDKNTQKCWLTTDQFIEAISELSDEEKKQIGMTDEDIEAMKELAEQAANSEGKIGELIDELNGGGVSGRQYLRDIIHNLMQTIINFKDTFSGVWDVVFGSDTAAGVKGLLGLLASLTGTIADIVGSNDLFKMALTGVMTVFKLIGKIIGAVAGAILWFATDVLGLTASSIGELVSKISGVISKLDGFTTRVKNIGGKVKQILDAWLDLSGASSAITAVKESFGNFFGSIGAYFMGGFAVIGDFIELIEKMPRITKQNMPMIGKYFKDHVLGYFLKINGESIFKVFGDAFKSMVDVIKPKFQPLTDGFNKVKTAISGFSTKAFDSFKKAIDTIKSVVEKNGGWGSVIKAVLGLVTMFELLRLLHGVASVPGRIADAFESIGDAIDALRASFIGVGVGTAFIGIGLGVLAIAGAIKLLSNIKWREAWPAAVAVVAILGLLVAAQYVLSKFGEGKAGQMTAFGFAMGAFAFAVSALLGMMLLLKGVTFGDFKGAIEILVVVTAVLVTSLAVLNDNCDWKSMLSISVAMLALTFALAGLLLVMVGFLAVGAAIGKMGEAAAPGIIALVAAIVLIVGSVAILGKTVDSENLKMAAVLMLALVFALNVLSNVLKKFTSMEWGDIGKGGAVILIMAAALTLFIWIVNKWLAPTLSDGIKTLARVILELAAAIALLAAAASVLGALGWLAIGPMIMMGLALWAFGGIIKKLNGTKFEASALAIMAVALAVSVLGAACIILGLFPFWTIAQGLIAVGAMLLALGYSMKLAGSAADKSTMANIFAMTAAIVALSVIVTLMQNIDWNKAGPAAIALALMMVALGGALALANIGADSSTSVSILAMVIAIAAIVGALYLLQDVPWQSLAAGAGALVVTMALLMLVMSWLGKKMSVGLGGVAAMAMMSVMLIALAYSFKMIASTTDDLDSVWKVLLSLGGAMLLLAIAIAIVAAAGPAVGWFVAAVVGLGAAVLIAAVGVMVFSGALYIIGEALPKIGDGFTAIGRGLADMVTSIASANDKVQAFLSVMSSIGQAIFDVLANVGAGLIEIGKGAMVAADGATLLGLGLIILTVGLALGAIGLIAVAAGLYITAIAANYAATGFLNLATSIGMGIVIIAAAWQILTQGSLEAGMNLVNGFAIGVTGNSDLATACVQSLGDNVIATLLGSLGEASPSVFAEEAGMYLDAGLANGIEGGKQGVFDKVKNLGSGLFDNMLNMDDLKDKAGSMGTDVTKLIMDGLLGNGGDDFNITDYLTAGTSKEDLMKAIGLDFSNLNLDGANMPDISQYTSMLQGGAGGGISLGGIDSTAMTEGLNTALADVSAKSGEFQNAGGDLIQAFNTGMVEVGVNTDAIEGSVDGILTNLGDKASEFKEAGKSMVTNIGEGMMEIDADEISGAVDEVVNGIVEYAKAKQNLFAQVGLFYDLGLATGISTKAYYPVLAAAKLGQDVAKALRNALGVSSPSKVTYGIGTWTTKGLSNALEDGASDVYDAGYGMGESAADGLSGALSMVNDILNSDMDYEPTITPVLDLSNVERGYQAIDSMGASAMALGMPRVAKTEEIITVNHTFDDITIKGVNSKEDFVAMANYTIDKITNTMRRQSRR